MLFTVVETVCEFQIEIQVPGCLVGNKNDINQDRQVITDKEAHKLAQELDLTYFKVYK